MKPGAAARYSNTYTDLQASEELSEVSDMRQTTITTEQLSKQVFGSGLQHKIHEHHHTSFWFRLTTQNT